MPRPKHLIDHLTYSNVVATLALFICLTGLSYAAVLLPPHSVGTQQLRAGAVTPSTLSFPLGVQGLTNEKPIDLTRKPGCNSPMPPGKPNRIFCRTTKIGAGLVNTVHVHLRSTGSLFVSAIAALRYEGPPNTVADVTLNLVSDGRVVSHSESVLAGGDIVQAPIQALIDVSGGPHKVGMALSANYSSYGSGDVIVAPVSVIVDIFPAT